MQNQRERARAARGNIGGWDEASKSLLSSLPKTVFSGYERFGDSGRVLAIIVENEDGTQSVDEISEGEFTVVLDRTPFYGESGGQIGDIGTLIGEKTLVNVVNTKKIDGVYLHICSIVNGILHVGDTVEANISEPRRKMIMRSHSACHLLQAALRTVLGTHVEQAGSYVSGDHVRFDFTHFAALTQAELDTVERLVNAHILLGEPITMTEMPIEEAKKLGAMALFGEKYGKIVRVVRMGNFSTEFCGGTHLDNTGKIGLFKIISESSVAAGVRRIEAVTGLAILELFEQQQNLLGDVASELKTQNYQDVSKRAAQVQEELRSARHEIESLNAKLASSKLDGVMGNAVSVGSVRLVCAKVSDMQIDAVRSLSDEIKAKYPDVVSVIAVTASGKLNFIASAGSDAVKAGAHAGKLVGGVASVTGGKGGGRPDNAMAGGQDVSKVQAALDSAAQILSAMLK